MKNMSMVAAAEVRSIAAALVLVLLAAEMLSAGPALRAQSSPDAVADALVDIGGRRLHVSCTGVGSPTVILEAGMGDSAATWKAIHPGVAEFTRVCAYDRAARGRSDSDTRTQLRTAGTVVEELSLLLGKVPIAGPYVLVGHSFGGLTYAATRRSFRLASRSSQGRLIVAEKSGHYVHLEEPALVIQAIRDVVAAGRQK